MIWAGPCIHDIPIEFTSVDSHSSERDVIAGIYLLPPSVFETAQIVPYDYRSSLQLHSRLVPRRVRSTVSFLLPASACRTSAEISKRLL
jgi:hypothetical protein